MSENRKSKIIHYTLHLLDSASLYEPWIDPSHPCTILSQPLKLRFCRFGPRCDCLLDDKLHRFALK